AALKAKLDMPVFVGMRHWKPTIGEAVWEAEIEGVDKLVAVAMAPQFAPISVGAYHEALKKVLPSKITAVPVMNWHREPELLQAWADRIPDGKRVIFTAHSIPVENSDPYPDQL